MRGTKTFEINVADSTNAQSKSQKYCKLIYKRSNQLVLHKIINGTMKQKVAKCLCS